MTKGRECDNCGNYLVDTDFDAYGSWSYTCPSCGFRYNHSSEYGRRTGREIQRKRMRGRMNSKLILSFKGGENDNEQAEKALKVLRLYRNEIMLATHIELETQGAGVYETNATLTEHRILHAFLYGFWRGQE